MQNDQTLKSESIPLEEYLINNSDLLLKNDELAIQLRQMGIESTRITCIAIHDYMKKIQDKA